MPNVDWNYHRTHCASCAKTAEFLAERGISIATRVDARTTPLVESDALELLRDVTSLYITRGTKVVHFDFSESRPADDALLPLMIGRSGKLRAPTIKVGQTVIIGFDQATYESVLS